MILQRWDLRSCCCLSSTPILTIPPVSARPRVLSITTIQSYPLPNTLHMSQPIFVGDPGHMVQPQGASVAVPRSMAFQMMKEFSLSDAFPLVDRETPLRVVMRLRKERCRSVDLQTVIAFVAEYGRLGSTAKVALLSEAHKEKGELHAAKVRAITPIRPPVRVQVQDATPELPELPPSSFDRFGTAGNINFFSASDDVAQTPEDFYYDNDPVFHPANNFDMGHAVSMSSSGHSEYVKTSVKTTHPAPFNAFHKTPLGNKPPPAGTPHRDRLTGIELKTHQQKGWAPYRKYDRGRPSRVQFSDSDEEGDLPDLDILSSTPPEKDPVTPVFSPTVLDQSTSGSGHSIPRNDPSANAFTPQVPHPYQSAQPQGPRPQRQPVTYGATVNGICLRYYPTDPSAPIDPPALSRWKSSTEPPIYSPNDMFYNAFKLQKYGVTIMESTDPQECAYFLKEIGFPYRDIRAILRMDDEQSGCFVKPEALRARISKRTRYLKYGGW